jgi:hypothetical protein
MRSIRFWIPVIIGALLTPIFFHFVDASGGSGASSHAGAGVVSMLLFYPVPVFCVILSGGGSAGDAFLSLMVNRLAFVGMILQFPLYGFIISYANLKKRGWLRLAAAVVWLHLVAIFAGLMLFFIQAAF